MFCFGLVRVWVKLVISNARMMPRTVMVRAAVFVVIGMVMGGVLFGRIYDVMSEPAKMLPRASRVMGLMILGLFSFMGVMTVVRVCPVWTIRVMRRV